MKKRQGQLDALRFFAALYIVMYHYADSGPEQLYRWFPFLANGFIATNLFLILSGFLLTHLHAAELERGSLSSLRFLARRMVRVWPAHWVVLLGFVLLFGAAQLLNLPMRHPERYDWQTLLPQALLIHAWGIPSQESWNMPSWTLSALVFCYLLFPALVQLTRKRRYAIWWLLGTLVLLEPLNQLGYQLTGKALSDLPFWICILRALPLFMLGIALARVDPLRAPRARFSGLVVSLVACSAFALFELWQGSILWVIGVNALMVVLAARLGSTPRLSRIGKYLGELSFPLYLVHSLIGAVWFAGLRAIQLSSEAATPQGFLLWSLAFPLAFGTAVLFMKWVDGPLQQWIRPKFEGWAESVWVTAIRAHRREKRLAWALQTQEMPLWKPPASAADSQDATAAVRPPHPADVPKLPP